MDFSAYQAAFSRTAPPPWRRLSARRAGRRTDRDVLTGTRACEGRVCVRVRGSGALEPGRGPPLPPPPGKKKRMGVSV